MKNALVNQIVDGNSSMHAEVRNRHRTVILPTVLRVGSLRQETLKSQDSLLPTILYQRAMEITFVFRPE